VNGLGSGFARWVQPTVWPRVTVGCIQPLPRLRRLLSKRPFLIPLVGQPLHVLAVIQAALARGHEASGQGAPVETVRPEIVHHAAGSKLGCSAFGSLASMKRFG